MWRRKFSAAPAGIRTRNLSIKSPVLLPRSYPSALWMYCPGYAVTKGIKRPERLAGKATITSGLRLGISEVLRRFRRCLRPYSQGHHINDHPEERRVEKRKCRRSSLKARERTVVSQTNIRTVSKDEKGPSSIRPTSELFHRQRRNNFRRTGRSA